MGNVTSTVISKIWIVSSIVCQRLGVQCTREPAIPRLESALEIYVHLSIICNDVALAQARQNLLAGNSIF
jgi:hypothetical protein